MTRDEAKRKIMDALFPPGSYAACDYGLNADIVREQKLQRVEDHLNVAVALGTVTLDEPKTVEQEAAAFLSRIRLVGRAPFVGYEGEEIVDQLAGAGFKIVRENG